jgi:hypothetical protein
MTMPGDTLLGTVRQSVVRRWLEVLLPLYTLGFLAVMLHPENLPWIFNLNLNESVLPWIGWALVGAMTGILILWALIVTFFLVYSPFYLLGRIPTLFGKGAWVDRRELRFYVCCLLLLCALAFLFYGDPWKGLMAFTIVAGCGPVFWRWLV